MIQLCWVFWSVTYKSTWPATISMPFRVPWTSYSKIHNYVICWFFEIGQKTCYIKVQVQYPLNVQFWQNTSIVQILIRGKFVVLDTLKMGCTSSFFIFFYFERSWNIIRKWLRMLLWFGTHYTAKLIFYQSPTRDSHYTVSKQWLCSHHWQLLAAQWLHSLSTV